MSRDQMSEDERAAEDFKRRHAGKLPWLFIVFFAAICAGIESVAPADGYSGHFARLLFFGGFCWVICRALDQGIKK